MEVFGGNELQSVFFTLLSLLVGFVTAPMLLNGGQPNFARCLAVSWVIGTLYLFHDLLLRSYRYRCVWSVITAHNLTPEKHDNNSRHPLTPTYNWHFALLWVSVTHTLTCCSITVNKVSATF